MQLLGSVPIAVVALTLSCLARAQDATTALPDDSTSYDILTTGTPEDSTTVESTEASFRSAETETVDGSDSTTTVGQETTTEATIDDETTTVTFGDDVTDTNTPAEEEEAKKEHVPEVAETSTTAVPERKPVKEPPFIKKYWPLLCLATKCDKRGSVPAPVIPDPDAPEVRSDLEESRSANSSEEDDSSSAEAVKTEDDSRTSAEVLNAIEEQTLADQPADSQQTTDRSVETTHFSLDAATEESGVTGRTETTTVKSSSGEETEKSDEDHEDDDDDGHDDDENIKKKDVDDDEKKEDDDDKDQDDD